MNDWQTSREAALPPMIDTHCHLDDRQFTNDLDLVLEASTRAGVSQWILIGYDPGQWHNAITMSAKHAGMHHTLGVHPSCADQWSDAIGDQLLERATSSRAVGIGEAGLDFYRDNAPYEIQANAFADQLDIAATLNLPMVIHMRDAEKEILDILRSRSTLPTLIFHSFDGGNDLVRFIQETGSYVGVGGLATRQKSDMLRVRLKQVPLGRLLLETDSPYLVPAKTKDRRNQPANIVTIVNMMAGYLDVAPDQLATITTSNAERVFGLSHE